jgi:hypothetical protein
MKSNSMICCMFIFLMVIFILILTSTADSPCVEKFGNLLGSLGPYKEELNECLNQVEKSNIDSRTNLIGSMYCNSILTEKSKRGLPPVKYPRYNNLNICRRECDLPGMTYNKNRECINICHGLREAADICAVEFCPYSDLDPEICMEACISRMTVTNNQSSWNWKPV